MTEQTKRRQPPDQERDVTDRMDEPLPTPSDPDASSTKGYSADPRPEPALKEEEPVPLVPSPDGPSQVHVPERDHHVAPTGRKEPGPYTPNDRLMGADR